MPDWNEFDGVAWCYDMVPVPTHAKKARHASNDCRGTVVDLGGGTGKFSARIAPHAADIVVVDGSHKMLRRARRRGLHTTRAIVERLPLPDASADLVLATEAFHHFMDGDAVLREAARILRPDGRLVVEEPDPSRWLGGWMERMEHWQRLDSTFRTPATFQAMAADHFAHVQTRRSGWFTYIATATGPRRRMV